MIDARHATSSPDYHRVEKAIRFLEERRPEQPTLDELAEHVGVSKYHFHRIFQRWAGVTPKRFLQYLTVEHARSLLEESASVLDAAYRSGLSGGGRLHDHFVQLEAVTPGEVKAGGRDLEIRAGVHPSPFGPALVGATERGICFLAFLPPSDPGDREPDVSPATEPEGLEQAMQDLKGRWPAARVVRDDEGTGDLAGRAFGPLTGEEAGPPLPLHLKGTNFQVQVWKALLRIPAGRVTTYGDLARSLGRPDAARAVGGAVGRNPVSYLIPCHRVIRSVGEFGAYRWGAARKRAMLGWESAQAS